MIREQNHARRFLIVDDAPAIRLALQDCLEGCRVHPKNIEVAADAEEGLAAFRDFEPDIVFLDLQMPGGASGLDLGKAMLAERPRLRIVVVTGMQADAEELTELRSAGAFHILRKPVKFEDIEDTLGHIDREESKLKRIT